MTRKLLRTMTALSATATVFTVLLLAARPVVPVAPAPLAADAAAGIDAGVDADTDAEATPSQRHLHRARALLALPYFSFAQGLRRTRS
jgi:hypothetical protein